MKSVSTCSWGAAVLPRDVGGSPCFSTWGLELFCRCPPQCAFFLVVVPLRSLDFGGGASDSGGVASPPLWIVGVLPAFCRSVLPLSLDLVGSLGSSPRALLPDPLAFGGVASARSLDPG